VEIKPLAGLTHTVRIVLWVDVTLAALLAVRSTVFFLYIAGLAQGSRRFAFGGAVADFTRPFLQLDVLFSLVVMILFLVWIHRVSTNLQALSGEKLEFTPGWAVGWFFVPFANLVQPYRVLRDLWRVSHRGKHDPAVVVVGWWWGLWLLGYVLSISAVLAAPRIASPTTALLYVSLLLGAAIAAFGGQLVRLALVGGIAAGYTDTIVEPADGVAPAAPTALAKAPAGWHVDPLSRNALRYWDGAVWTPSVFDDGTQGQDPL